MGNIYISFYGGPAQLSSCENIIFSRKMLQNKAEAVNVFTGNYCEVNIDECISSPCLHNATCVDLVHGYGCVCKLGFTG